MPSFQENNSVYYCFPSKLRYHNITFWHLIFPGTLSDKQYSFPIYLYSLRSASRNLLRHETAATVESVDREKQP